MFGFGIWELLVVLAIVLLVVGPKRLKTLGTDLGGTIKGFRTAIKDEPAEQVEATSDAKSATSSASATGSASATDSKVGPDQKTNV